MTFFVERFIMENNNSNKKEGFLQKFGDPLLSALKPLDNKNQMIKSKTRISKSNN